MTFKVKVKELLIQELENYPELFLIDLTINESNKITITLDGDNGVSLKDCIQISRAIESKLDREENDFALEVTSVWVSSPLMQIRQYKKNIGRYLIIKTKEQSIEALLKEVSDTFITVEWETRESKKTGKGKETVQHKENISFKDIIEAIVTVKF